MTGFAGGYSSGRPYPFVVAIVQARMGGERFPGKVMADLAGKPVLWHVLERLRRCEMVNQIVVASPDLEIVEFANHHRDFGFHAPDHPNNVLERYVKASNWVNADIVVRITADCPLICPEIVDNTIKGYVDNRVDISTNVLRRTYPQGLDVEVTHKNVLKRIYHLTDDSRYREHVTLYAYENPALFRFNSVFDSKDNSRFMTCVDTPADLDRLRGFFDTVDSMNYTYEDILRYFNAPGR